MKPLLSLLFLFVFTVGCSSQSSEKVQLISAIDLQKALVDDIQLVDVRTPEEYKSGHIGNAKNIDYYSETFKTEIQKLDTKKPVYIYCHSGGRSHSAAEIMISLGFTKIYDLEGGIISWNKTKN